MSDTTDNHLEEAMQSPKRASNDAGSVEQHPLSEQIELDRYLNSKKASRKNGLGIRINRIVPPGSA